MTNEEHEHLYNLGVGVAELKGALTAAREDHRQMNSLLVKSIEQQNIIIHDHEERIRKVEDNVWKNRLGIIIYSTLGGGAAGAAVVKFFGLPIP